MAIKLKRHNSNPLIKPTDVTPLFPNFKVDCVFNAGVTIYKNETLLLLRVAESIIATKDGDLIIPVLEQNGFKQTLVVKSFNTKTDTEKYDFSDSRSIAIKDSSGNKKTKYLTSLSHLRIARSKDGIDFTIDKDAFIFPTGKYEAWGIEDPRITKLEDDYLINYTGVSEYGACTVLVKTRDFVTYERLGVIFPPENKDVSLFPEKINGLYHAYHRPVPKSIGTPDIWSATSPDLINWGNHKHLLGVSQDGWESGRIGGGAPSFKTPKGWIHIYHAADEKSRYCLGAFITDLKDPSVILAKTKEPILEPETDYELNGFFSSVIFTCGLTVKHNTVKIYYGAADKYIALAEIQITELYEALGIN